MTSHKTDVERVRLVYNKKKLGSKYLKDRNRCDICVDADSLIGSLETYDELMDQANVISKEDFYTRLKEFACRTRVNLSVRQVKCS